MWLTSIDAPACLPDMKAVVGDVEIQDTISRKMNFLAHIVVFHIDLCTGEHRLLSYAMPHR
jgi:hypothetical protein